MKDSYTKGLIDDLHANVETLESRVKNLEKVILTLLDANKFAMDGFEIKNAIAEMEEVK